MGEVMIRTEALACRVGDFRLREVDLEVARGEYFVLLGPPGSGKTVLLECLCGLQRVQSGRILIGGADATLLEPRRRGIGYVPQDYALFPHRSVAGNVAFGLEAMGLEKAERGRRIDETAGRLAIRHLLARCVAGLSGGEKQRVALARALAVAPRVLLLDEPVSALDENTREAVCLELKRLQRGTGTTAVHVCHNFEEARLVADRIGVMRDGVLVQSGTPEELFARPRDAEMARFLRVGSLLEGAAETAGEGALVRIGPLALRADAPAAGPVLIAVRADEVLVTAGPPEGGGPNVLEGTAALVSPRGVFARVDVEVAPGIRLTAHLPKPSPLPAPGGRVWVKIPPSAIHVFKA